MKLYNTVIIYDVYAVANSGEEATKAVLAAIREGVNPSEMTALETRTANNIRQSWLDQGPYVGADISDSDFEKKIKGKTTFDMFKAIYTRG